MLTPTQASQGCWISCFSSKIDLEIPQECHYRLDTDCGWVKKAKHPKLAVTDRSHLSGQLTPRCIYNTLCEKVSFCLGFSYFPVPDSGLL